jgi:crotonobetainyl-CoA:carnitine CoA-transferase CaiB-like acyl-CoA transferase
MGPLKGFKIIEIAGIGPGQLAGMLLADMGASLVRIDRVSPMPFLRGFAPESWSGWVWVRKNVWLEIRN